jgi:predicted phage baseplate assembly protein
MMYKAESLPPERVVQDSNFVWRDLSADLIAAREEDSALSVFDITQDTAPTLYLGFTAPFAAEQAALYIRIDEEHSSRSRDAVLDTFFSDGPLADIPQKRSLTIDWEYWNGAAWTSLPVNDYTDSFHESGFVEFDPPVNMSAKQELARELYWLRARFVSGGFESQPKILAILTNAVYARNQTRHVNEIAGSGTGAPLQSVSPAHGPLLPGVTLFVDEGSIPPGNELTAMGKEGVSEPYLIEGDRVWVRYTEKNNFYASGPGSRHFVVDYRARRILFGDGERGINLPRRKFNIRIAEYYTGGGSDGNVAAGTLRILARSIPFIAACDNPFPAEGGADMEDVEALKSRAAGVFKSLHRAVTAEDFQWLSREASASVGRASCLKDLNRQGEIVIIIVPVKSAADDLRRKLVPSRELIRRVTAYLDERKLVGTRIRVQGPVYRAFRVSLSLLFRSDVLDDERLKKEIDASLRTAFHALIGGDGAGWEFGRTVSVGVVFKQLERISGMFWIDHVRITDLDAGVDVGSLVLRPDELPYLDDIQIDTRRTPA